MIFLTRIAVEQDKKTKARKIFVDIGIAACLISILCGILTKEFKILTMLVPYIFLVSIRLKMRGKYFYKDVKVEIQREGFNRVVTVYNCINVKKNLYSCRYEFNENSQVNINYDPSDSELVISGFGKKVVYSNIEILSRTDNTQNNIIFYTDKFNAKNIVDFLIVK